MSDSRPPNPRTARRRWSLAMLVLVLVLAAAAVVPTTSPASAQSTTRPRLELVSQSPWTAPTGEFRLQVLPDAMPPGTTLEVQVHQAVIGRIRFDRSTRGEDLSPPLRPGPAPIVLDEAPRAPGGGVEVTIPVVRTGPVPDGGLLLSREGVHPVVVAAVDPDGDELARIVTHLIRLPPTGGVEPPLAVAPIVAIDGTATPTESDGLALDDGDAAQAVAVIEALAAVPSVALTIEPTPSVLAALTTLDDSDAFGGTAAPVTALANHLAGRQVLAAPYADVDIGAWVAAGLEPELDTQLVRGAEVTASLLGVTPDGRTALADPSLTPEALSRLHDLGTSQIVVPSDQVVDPPTSEVTFTDVFELDGGPDGTLSAVTADPDLLGRLTATDDPVLNAHLALADLAVLYSDAPAKSRGVALDLGAEIDPVTLTTLLTGLAETSPPGSDARPMVSPVTIDDLFRVTEAATVESQSRSTSLVLEYRSAPPNTLGSYPSELRTTDRQVSGFESLTEPAPSGTAIGLERAVLLSGASSLTAGERSEVLRAVTARVDATTAQVLAPLQQYVTLTSRSGKIPLNLENRLPFPVRVHVVLESVKLEFPAGNVIDVELPAAETTRLDVEVTTRASGAFPLEVSVRSPDEVLEMATTSFTVRSTAISGAGMVLSVGAGLFLLVWWGRHFRKVRRARQLVASDHPALGASALGPD